MDGDGRISGEMCLLDEKHKSVGRIQVCLDIYIYIYIYLDVGRKSADDTL